MCGKKGPLASAPYTTGKNPPVEVSDGLSITAHAHAVCGPPSSCLIPTNAKLDTFLLDQVSR